MTKCNDIFDLLVAYGKILVPQGAKVSPLEQRKKIDFCKYHNLLRHKTSQCFIFKDLVQSALKCGGLNFTKSKVHMKIDYDPL